jgi:hypothetical protein
VHQKTEPETRYQDLIDDLLGSPGVTPPPMREWFSVDPESALPWLPLARQALDFARGDQAARAEGKSR